MAMEHLADKAIPHCLGAHSILVFAAIWQCMILTLQKARIPMLQKITRF